MLVWDVTCPDIFTLSYTSVEVGVASSSRAEDENFKISDYFYHTFFHLYQNRVVWGLLSLSEQVYHCLTIMGNLAGIEERSVDLLHN